MLTLLSVRGFVFLRLCLSLLHEKGQDRISDSNENTDANNLTEHVYKKRRIFMMVIHCYRLIFLIEILLTCYYTLLCRTQFCYIDIAPLKELRQQKPLTVKQCILYYSDKWVYLRLKQLLFWLTVKFMQYCNIPARSIGSGKVLHSTQQSVSYEIDSDRFSVNF